MYDELELDLVGDRKTALFFIISDTDATFNFLVSMAYTQLFNLLCERADDKYGGRLPVHVRCLIDEAANIGQIPNLEKLMATIRSREISACLVLQAQSQLKALYKDNMDTIIGNCDASLFLGGKEETTLKSWNSLLGKETIDMYNTSVTKGNQESHGQNFQKLVKDLMSVDELAVMDGGKCLLQIRGVRPFLSRKYDITKHPNYVGSDGQHYYSPAPYTCLVYNSDGTMDVRTSSGGSAYRHYMLTASDGSSQQVYCVESGIAYNTSDNTYTSESGTNSNYLNLLPSGARRGITLTAIYGWKPGASLPVSGINEDDYKMATQIILWEYQQQLRSDPYSRHGNGHADADQYFSVIAGHPAERAYNWILEQVASHSTVPSFTSTKKSEAPELELKWDTEKKVYTLTVTDTNNLKINLEILKGSGVSVTRKTYDAVVVLDDTGGKYVNFRLEFPAKKGRGK